MSLIEVLFIAVGLATDATAVCLAAGACRPAPGRRAAARLAFHFGLFQFMMPVLGWYAGTRIAGHIAPLDHWLAFGLLAFVGIRMIRSGAGAGPACPPDPSRGMTLVSLSLATSIDALAVGLSLAVLDVRIWQPSAIIGGVTMILALSAVYMGRRLGAALGRRAEICGGIVLILIGARILWTHLT
jgi:putative Mn2+ efflux pump MntP